jgi:hypothetical protein
MPRNRPATMDQDGAVPRAYVNVMFYLLVVGAGVTGRLEDLHALAKELLEYETLSGEEIRMVLRGEKIVRKVVDEPAPDQRRGSVPPAAFKPALSPGNFDPLPVAG